MKFQINPEKLNMNFSKIIYFFLLALFLVSCAEINGYGWGSGNDRRGKDELRRIYSDGDDTLLFSSRMPLKGQGEWMYSYSSSEKRSKKWGKPRWESVFAERDHVMIVFGFGAYRNNIIRVGENYAEKIEFSSNGLELYLDGLKNRDNLLKMHREVVENFYKEVKGLTITERKLKDVICFQSEGLYDRSMFFEIKCPVFYRNTLGVMSYLLYSDPLASEESDKKEQEILKGSSHISSNQRVRLAYQKGVLAINHIFNTTEFVEPVTQKIPEGFSLEEQFNRMKNNPDWKL